MYIYISVCVSVGAIIGVATRRGQLRADQVGLGRSPAARREERVVGVQAQNSRR